MANKNFLIKNGLTVGGAEIVNSSGALTQSLITAVPSGAAASTQSVGNSSTAIATTAYVRGEIDALINSAPGTLNTLDELAAAINDDAAFNTTLTAAVALKSNLASPTFTGTITAATINTTGNLTIDSAGSAAVTLDRASTSTGSTIDFKTAGTLKWYMGLRGLTNDNWYLRDEVGSTNALTVTSGGNLTVAGTLGVTGAITADAGIDVDNFNLDGTTLALSSGNMTIESAGEMILKQGGGIIRIYAGSTQVGGLATASNNLTLKTFIDDKDILFNGYTGGSVFTALTLDMSDSGAAYFNGDVRLVDDKTLRIGSSSDLQIYHIADSINVIRGSGGMVLQTDDTSYGIQMGTYSGGETMFKAVKNGAVTLYYDNAVKLTTGSGDLAFTIGNTSTDTTVNMSRASGGAATYQVMQLNTILTLGSTSGSTTSATHIRGGSSTVGSGLSVLASGNVGIGETSPDTQLHVKASNNSAGDLYTAVGPGNVPSITIQNAGTTNDNNAALFFKDNDSHVASIAARFKSHTGGDEKTQLRFSVTGAGNTREKVVITEDGHMGIGTMTPGALLDVGGGSIADPTILIDSASGGDPTLIFDTGATNRTALIRFQDQGAVHGFMKYEHNGDKLNIGAGSATATTLSVGDSRIGIGLTDPRSDMWMTSATSNTTNRWGFGGGRSGTNKVWYTINESNVGVYIGHGSTSWTAHSDERIKDNIVSLGTVLPDLMNMRCVKYNRFGDDGANKTKIGFIAQDWETKFPEIIDEMGGLVIEDDGTLSMEDDSDSTTIAKGLSYTETIPVLLKAIQEQQTIIEDLKSRITTLEG